MNNYPQKAKRLVNGISNFAKKVLSSITIGYLAFKSPTVLHKNNFLMLIELLVVLFSVSINGKAVVKKLYFNSAATGEKKVISIWIGLGDENTPTAHVAELIRENKILREKACKC